MKHDWINMVKSKFVFKLKRDRSPSIKKYKVRLVATGFSEEEGVDYLSHFPSCIGSGDQEIIGNADLEEDVYMSCPNGVWAGR
jgi:hypothetical protein